MGPFVITFKEPVFPSSETPYPCSMILVNSFEIDESRTFVKISYGRPNSIVYTGFLSLSNVLSIMEEIPEQ